MWVKEIWYLFVFLPRITIQQLPDLKSNNLKNSYHFEDLVNKDKLQYEQHHPDINGYYSNKNEIMPNKRGEREIQEYENYEEVKETPHLSKGGLNLFSWWKSATDARRRNKGTLSPLNVGTTTVETSVHKPANASIISAPTNGYNINNGVNLTRCSKIVNGTKVINGSTVTSNTNLNSRPNVARTSPGSTYLTTYYTDTLECSDLAIGFSETCEHIDTSNKTFTHSDEKLCSGGDTPVSVTNATKIGALITVAAQPINTPGTHNTNTKMYSGLAGKILPVNQVVMAPFILSNTAPLTPSTRKSSKEINILNESRIVTSKENNVSNFNEKPLQQNYTNYNNRTYSPGTSVPTITKGSQVLSSVPMVKINSPESDQIVMTNYTNLNTNNLPIRILNYERTQLKNGILNPVEGKNQTDVILREEIAFIEDKNALKQTEKSIFEHQIMFNPTIANFGEEIKDKHVTLSQAKNKPFSFPFNKDRSDQVPINKAINNFYSNTFLIDSSPVNLLVQKNIPQLLQNKVVPSGEKKISFKEVIKYPDSYLSKNSSSFKDLAALCKNVTCQGNDYLPQCCSRICPQGKCKVNINYGRNALNYSCSPKQSSRVIRENSMNDFVRFQLMHGLTPPNNKELMNALKEAIIQEQKINREFRSDDLENIFHTNVNGQNVPQFQMSEKHRLSKKEPEAFISPQNANKILEDLRATLSSSLLQANPKSNTLHKDKFRITRNQGLKDELESIKENKMILVKLREEIEMELKRLFFLEKRRREEELFFDQERKKELNELKTIQELIHREFESRAQAEPWKRAVPGTLEQSIINQNESVKKEGTYSKLVNNIEKSLKNNDIDNLILNRYSRMEGNRSNVIKSKLSSLDAQKFPELEIKPPESNPHDEPLLVLLKADKNGLMQKERGKRERQSNQVVRKNSINDFVRFQVMHDLTPPNKTS